VAGNGLFITRKNHAASSCLHLWENLVWSKAEIRISLCARKVEPPSCCNKGVIWYLCVGLSFLLSISLLRYFIRTPFSPIPKEGAAPHAPLSPAHGDHTSGVHWKRFGSRGRESTRNRFIG